MGNNKIYSILVIIGLFIQCSSIQMGKEKIHKPILFSSIRAEKAIPFKIEAEYIYWIGMNMNDSKKISELLNTELNKYQDSKGIRNLKIRYYEAYHDSPQSLYINPFTFIATQIYSAGSSIIMFSKKSIEITGEIYFL